MAAVKVTDLKNRATQIMRRVEKGDEFTVTKRGRPIAVILPIDVEDLEDWILANHPEAIRRRQQAAGRIAAGEYVTGRQLHSRLRKLRTRRRGAA
jgi:prevent-host-death family protein